ncbi:MAG: hypothetical protein M1839_004949 [Geoglossum umbratile]|nr:MAG: hypothetical protein M1839_004949 [Geoglossum umbratile]
MWKRKSVTAVKETQVADSPDDAPEPAPARSIRQYKVASASVWKRQFKVEEQPSRNVIYTLTFKGLWGMVLATGGAKNPDAATAAAANIPIGRTVSQIALGDPLSQPDRT